MLVLFKSCEIPTTLFSYEPLQRIESTYRDYFSKLLAAKAAERGLGWGKTTGGLGDGSPPAGSRGGAPVGGLGTKSPRSWRIFKVVTSKFYAFL